jgi:hypothetical protein
MRNSRRKSRLLISTLLLISVVSIPFVLTWRDVRQHQINHVLINAMQKGDIQYALGALNHGADGRAEVPEEETPPLSFAMVLRARLTGESVPTVHGTPSILVALGLDAAQWRPKDVADTYVPPPPENPQLVGALLAHGADPNVFGSTNAEGSAKTTPLLLALRWRYERVARLLVSTGETLIRR